MKKIINNEKKERIYWIDTIKAIGILFVINGHMFNPSYLVKYIYSFHMPLFFFISGVLFDYDKYDSYFSFLKKKFNSIIIPYFLFSIVTYLFWIFVGKNFGNDADLNISIVQPLIGIFYSKGINPWLIFNIPIWFLTCLFIVQNIYFFICKICSLNKTQIFFLIIVCSIIGYFSSIFFKLRLPWSIDVAFSAVVFYGIANLLKTNLFNSDVIFKKKSYILFYLIINIVFCYLNTDGVSMNDNHFGNYLYFYLSAFGGIFFYISIAKIIPQNKALFYIGGNSLIIMVLHLNTTSVLKGIQYFILDIPLSTLNDSVIISMVYTIGNIFLLLPIIYIINTYFPFFVGKKIKQNE